MNKNIAFKVNPEDIEILDSPLDFYSSVIYGIKKSKFRITMSSLYLGDSLMEKHILKNLTKKIEYSYNLRIKMLLDYNRCARNKNGESIINLIGDEILPYLEEKNKNFVDIGFYKKKFKYLNFLPNIIKEVLGTYHTKFWIFDDNIILTGANLSEDYFLNRKDRYIIINNCKELTNYFEDYLDILISNSVKLENIKNYKKDYSNKEFINEQLKVLNYQYDSVNFSEIFNNLNNNDNIKEKINENNNDYKYLPQKNIEFEEKIKNEFQMNDNENSFENILTEYNKKNKIKKIFKEKVDSNKDNDNTYIIPIINHNDQINNTEKIFLKNYLDKLENNDITFCSGYFNIPNFLKKYFENSSKKNDTNFICAELESNGFYGAKGIKGYIPFFYKYSFLKLFKILNIGNFYSYYDRGNVFHAKGFWNFNKNNNFSSTIIGSSNYSYRSFFRDVEVNFYICSNDLSFKNKILKEKNDIIENSNLINKDNFKWNMKRIKLKHKFWFNILKKFL